MTGAALTEYPSLLEVPGVRLGTARVGFYGPEREDLAVFSLADTSATAAVFTTNAFCAAPVAVARRHLVHAAPRYLLINSGNANAGTGERGTQDCLQLCAQVAKRQRCRTEAVLPFATGVIGQPLPLPEFGTALPTALENLHEAGWEQAAQAIMTTDRYPKGYSLRLKVDGHPVIVSAIAKGAGMICPDMATMLAFIATDASIDQPLLQACLQNVADQSFNCITVDGDTSTNDAVVLIATGRGPLPRIQKWGATAAALQSAISTVCTCLSEAIVRDGEGATRMVEFLVEGGRDQEECRRAARVVANSLLVKTALHGTEPNWGRFLAALGRSQIPNLDPGAVEIDVNGLPVVQGGCVLPGNVANSNHLPAAERCRISIRLGRGESMARILGCDLSAEYVRINADYRS